MKEFNVKSFSELHDVLTKYRKDNSWLFRGHSDPSWKLKPKAGRDEFIRSDDQRAFRAWKRRAVEFITLPFDDAWGWLAFAQHHGLATRLLDWTYNPLAAAFFAVSEKANTPAVIYAYKCKNITKQEDSNPFEVEGVSKIKPRGVAPRIIRQGGLFTIHGEPNSSMEDVIDNSEDLEAIIIDSEYRKELPYELSHYGINRSTLFPDLDGLSSYMNWATSSDYWTVPADKVDEEGE